MSLLLFFSFGAFSPASREWHVVEHAQFKYSIAAAILSYCILSYCTPVVGFILAVLYLCGRSLEVSSTSSQPSAVHMGAAAGVLAATDGDWSEEQVIQQLLPHYVKQPEKCLRVHNALVQLVMLEKDRQLSMKKETEVSARHAEREGGAHRRSQELEREKQLLAKKQELENELNRRKASLKQQGGGVVPADGEVQRMSGDLVRVINMARANPSSMVPYAEEHLKSFVDEYSYEDPLNRPNTLISTQEGRKGVMDCITFLQAASAVGQVEPNLCLENVASEYAHQTMSNAQFRPPAIGDLINKQGRWRGSIGQTVSYGNKDPFAIVLALLIDDGSVDKGHRRSIFDEKFLQVGAVLTKHDPDGYCCVIEYATAVFSWDTQQVDDVNISFSQWTRDYSQNEELFRKVVASIPNDNIEQEVDDLLRPRGIEAANFLILIERLVCIHRGCSVHRFSTFARSRKHRTDDNRPED